MVGYIGINTPVVEESLTNVIDSGSINNTTSGWTKSNSSAITLTQGTDYVTYTVSTTTTAEIYKTFSLGPYTSTTSTSTITYLATSSFYVRSSAPSLNSSGYFSGTHTTSIAMSSTGANNSVNKYFIPVDGAPPTSTSTYYGTIYYKITAATYSTYYGGIQLTLQATDSSLKTDKQIIYAQAKVKSSSSNSSYPIRYIRRYLNGSYDAYRLQAIDGTAETALNDNQWHTSSAYLETYDGTNAASYDRMCLQFNSAVVSDTFDFKDILVVNLTSAFGSGNEPSKLECDQNIYIENNSIVYRSPDSVAREIKNMYIGVGEVAHKVKKAYIGINNIARLWYVSASGSISYYGTTPSTLANTLYYPGGGSVGDYALFVGGRGSSYYSNAAAYNSQLVKSTPTSLYETGNGFVSANMGTNYVAFAPGKNAQLASQYVNYYNTSLVRSYINGVLPFSCTGVAAASVGDWAVFAGGYSSNSDNRLTSGSIAYFFNPNYSIIYGNLTGYRYEACGGSVGDYALFVGGIHPNDSSQYYSNVDAFNSSGVLTVAFSGNITAGTYISAKAGEYVVFVRNNTTPNIAYAFDSSLVIHSLDSLTNSRTNMGAGSLSDNALFAGGSNGTYVEYYNGNLIKGLLDNLSVRRNGAGVASVGNYILFAGGTSSSSYYSDTVDVYVLNE